MNNTAIADAVERGRQIFLKNIEMLRLEISLVSIAKVKEDAGGTPVDEDSDEEESVEESFSQS